MDSCRSPALQVQTSADCSHPEGASLDSCCSKKHGLHAPIAASRCVSEEIDDTDSDIQIKDPLFIRKLHFIPLQSCPRTPAQIPIV